MAQAKQQIVKYQKGKHSFKVVCHPGAVLQYREGKLGFGKVLQLDIVFTNVVRGDRASAADLSAVFGPNFKEDEILKTIVEEGEIEYSASERRKFMDDKTNEIVYYIHKNWIDPKTKLPHPIDRIKNAISSSKKKIIIDLKKDSKKQAESIVKKLQGTIMFAKAAVFAAELTIKYSYDGKCKNIIHGSVSKVVKEDYTGEGCVYTIEMTKSEMDQLIVKLSKPTNGDYNMSMLDENALSGNGNSGTGGGSDEKESKSSNDKRGKKHKKKKQSSKHGQIGQQNAAKQQKEKEKHDKHSKSNKNKSENIKPNDVISETSSSSDHGKKKKKKKHQK